MAKGIKVKQEFSEEAMYLFNVLKSWYERDRWEAAKCKDTQQAVLYLGDRYSDAAWDAAHKQWEKVNEANKVLQETKQPTDNEA